MPGAGGGGAVPPDDEPPEPASPLAAPLLPPVLEPVELPPLPLLPAPLPPLEVLPPAPPLLPPEALPLLVPMSVLVPRPPPVPTPLPPTIPLLPAPLPLPDAPDDDSAGPLELPPEDDACVDGVVAELQPQAAKRPSRPMFREIRGFIACLQGVELACVTVPLDHVQPFR
jgi:hypothetical protein